MKELINQLQVMPESVRMDIFDRARRKRLNRVMNDTSGGLKPEKPTTLAALIANNSLPQPMTDPRKIGGTLGALTEQ